MPITCSCSRCGASLQVKHEFAGRQIKCRECGAGIRVPSRKKRRKKSSGGSNTALIVGGIIGAVLLVCGGGVAVVAMMVMRAGGDAVAEADFAPGGQPVDPSPRPNAAPGEPAAPSRFDAPAVDSSGATTPGSQTSGPVNPSAGTGLGATICVADYWSGQSQFGQEDEVEVLNQEPDVLPPDDWNVRVDPPGAPLEFSPGASTRRVKVPTGSQRATAEDIVFSAVPSGIAALGQNATENDRREVWDLTRMEKIGTITGLGVETTMNAVGPDGRYFAGVTGRIDQVIGVWDVEEKKVAVDIPVSEDAKRIEFLGIPSPERLVGRGWWNSTYYVWSLPEGSVRQEIKVDWPSTNLKAPAFTPGGRYMAVVVRDRGDEKIKLYDLDSGREAGALSLPDYGVHFRLSVHGIAFSPDGTLLGAIVNGWSASKLLVWDVESGEIVDHMTFEKTLKELAFGDSHFGKEATPLVWFPGNELLLAFEMLVLDRRVDAAIWKLSGGELRDSFPGNRRPVGDHQLTTLSTAGRDGFIEIQTLEEDDLQEARDKVQADDSRAPKVPSLLVDFGRAAAVDLSSVRRPEAGDIAWSAGPDPAPSNAGAARTTELAIPKGTIRQVGLSRTGAARAVVLRGTSHVPWSRIPDGNTPPSELETSRWHAGAGGNEQRASAGSTQGRAWIDVYELSTGERMRELRLPQDADLLAVSPDGGHCLAMTYESGSNRLLVLSTEDGECLANWIPYNVGGDDARLLVSAEFAGAEHVVTLSGTGVLMIWRIPDVKAIFEVGNASQPASSAGGRFVSYSDGSQCHFVEVASGSVVGRIPDVGDLQATAYHPDGSRAALLSRHKAGYYLFTVDLASGEVSPPFPVPITSGFLRWFGDRYLLVDNQKLVDVEQKTVAWSYQLDGGDHVPHAPDERHWFVADSDGKAILAAASLPDSTAERQLAGASLQPEFLVQPGDAVSLSVQLNHPAFTASVQSDIEGRLQSQLESNRISIASGQPVTLHVTAAEQTGETVTRQYSPFGVGDMQEVTFTIRNMHCRAYFMASGEAAWAWENWVSNDSWFVSYEEGESIANVLEESYRDSLPGAFDGVVLPPYVFTPTAANGLGSTKLSP
ncbi:MAG: hypothetical protein DWQ34_12025 [Planctomycetota bacterium]|nr:MAG: hypothetical protein DWQ34_12025 [Planctomycetota bacterium]REK26150.1 MAG: hypothetical protein DWQ41_10870 [Planctomycetota bacterium]REK33519.1 MAG: hypothetical protein DWQ45_15135 [Planctomycetota bacterium]